MWTFGYFNLIEDKDVVLGESDTLKGVLTGLLEYVRNEVEFSDLDDMSVYATLESDISRFLGEVDEEVELGDFSFYDAYDNEFYVQCISVESDEKDEEDE